jgi:porphobilinogen synthase
MNFPIIRKRRLRRTPQLRDLVAETVLRPEHLIYPLFVNDDVNSSRVEVPSMPGIYQQSIDNAVIEAGQALELGIKGVIVFGIPSEKDPEGSNAWFEEGVAQRAIQALKTNFGDDLIVIADTCLCEYTSHGHCGVLMDGKVLNDPTLDLLCKVAVSQAEAGADIIAPSDMMDGRIGFIRDSLDDAGFDHVPILSYAAKYATALYAPFRDAAGSTPASGDRRSYQMDLRNAREAIDEVEQDISEGADMIMIKPALPCLDIIRTIRDEFTLPLVAYNVSGEYGMVKAAAENGWIDERSVVLELLTSIRRAGADMIISYHAKDAARWLQDGHQKI